MNHSKRNGIIIIFLVLSFIGFAQGNPSADRVVNDFLNSVKSTAIKANFKLMTTIKTDHDPQTSSGSFMMKDKKFVLDMAQIKIWYDGRTQWSYSVQDNEITISDPTEKELSRTNPISVISNYKAQCMLRLSKRSDKSSDYIIEMTPSSKKTEILKVEVNINKTTNNLTSTKIYYLNGSTAILTLSNFQRNASISNTVFTYPNKYKNAIINDLR